MSAVTSMPTVVPTGITVLDNVARIEGDGVYVFDRRRYPFEQRWVRCDDVAAVAQSIIDMVTQSHGPAVVAGYGLALGARQTATSATPDDDLRRVAQTLIETRPTNDSLRNLVSEVLAICLRTPVDGREHAATAHVLDHLRARRHRAAAIGRFGAQLLSNGPRLLTHCWAETGIAEIVQTAVQSGIDVRAYCPETRPYLQGARLTADALRDAGATVTVIPDPAVGHLISEGLVDIAITGADRITADGGVVNKIGTLAIATLCRDYSVPYYPICTDIDEDTLSVAQVPIEIRDGNEALYCLGHRTATHDVAGFYPAFDRTPAHLVSGYITPDGVRSARAFPGQDTRAS